MHGLLPDPFPVPASTKRRAAFEAVGSVLARIPAVAKAATRKAGGSMVVVTDYEFDADAWRAKAGEGPDVYAVEVGTGGHDWSRFPLEPGPLQLHHNGPAGIRRITFEGDGAVPARRRRVRVQLGGVIDSELGSPARSFATWSVMFVSDSRSVPDWTACEHDRLQALDLLSSVERRLELRAGRDHEPVVVARDQVARRDAHAAEQDRPADPRRDVAAARHRDRAAGPQRQIRQPGAIAHVAVDHDPAQLPPPRLGGQQLAQRGQRAAARLDHEHVARGRLADRVEHREELAGRPRPCKRGRRPAPTSAAGSRDRRPAATCRRRTAC